MDRLDEWRIFAAVAALRSFSKAAKQLGRSPQAVTRAVAALEARLGTRLLHRTTRSVSLSNDGASYLERSRRALAELDALEAPRDPELRGTLAVTAPVLFGQLHVAPIVASFLEEHTATAVRMVLLDRTVSLAEEALDVGIRIGHLADSALIARSVGHVRTVICASPAYLERAGTPRHPDALAKHATIAHTVMTPLVDRWAFPGERRDRTVAVQPRWVVNTGQAAIDAAVAGHGLARVLSYQIDALVEAKRLRIVLASFEPPPLPVHVVTLPGQLPRVAAAFVEHATARLRAKLR